MDDRQFDTLAKSLTTSPTRRDALRVLVAALLGGLPGFFGLPEAADEASGRQQRRRRQRRRQRRRKRSSNDCPTGQKRCDGDCISAASCCTNDDCSGGRICDAQSACACPSDRKPCDGACISAGACCTSDDCAEEHVCNAQKECVCSGDRKPCDGDCIANSACCGSCPPGATCREGECSAGSGPSLYPELRSLPPTDLHFDQLDDGTHLLRFSNTVWNAGEGRLELEGEPHPRRNVAKRIYQNLYDAPAGGNLTSHKQVASDVIYHASHEHFHFADFASYLLLKQNSAGDYQATTKRGSKTSFCIMDTARVQGNHSNQYQLCGRELQGLSVGWGDTYDSSLPDQWVVLGAQLLSDGAYGLQSTADPKGVLDEGGKERETNNTAATYFRVVDGAIQNVRDTP